MKYGLLYNIVTISFCLVFYSCSKQPDYLFGEKVWVHRANEMVRRGLCSTNMLAWKWMFFMTWSINAL